MSTEKPNLSLTTSSFSLSGGPLSHPQAANEADSPLAKAKELVGKGKTAEALALLAPLRHHSKSADALAITIETQGQQLSALMSVQLLQSFYAEAKTAPEVLGKLAKGVEGKQSLREAYAALSGQEQSSLREKVGGERLSEILSLADNQDPQSFWIEASHFGLRLKQADQLNSAGAVLSMIAQGGEVVPAEIRQKAQLELDAMVGKGSSGLRTEFLLGQFTKQATDAKTIVPMLLSSAAFGLVRSATLGRLALSTEATWLTRGFGARLAAGTTAFMVEAPLFALSGKALQSATEGGVSWDGATLGKDLLSSYMTLGALKAFAFAGNQAFLKAHGIGELEAAQLTKLQRFSQGAFAQASMFTGMLASHKLEEATGLRKKVDGATAVTDTLASMVSLGVGGHLGNKMLGRGFAEFQQELGIRAEIYGRALDAAPRGEKQSPLQWLTSTMQGGNGFPPGMAPAMAGAGGRTFAGRPVSDGKSDHIVKMEAHEGDEASQPPDSGGRVVNPKEPGAVLNAWMELAQGKQSFHLRVPEALFPQAKEIWEQRAGEVGESKLEMVGAYLKGIHEAKPGEKLSEAERLELLSSVYGQFDAQVLGKREIHAATRGLAIQGELLRTYYESKAELQAKGLLDETAPRSSALLSAAEKGRAGLFVQFGGQANAYFEELRTIYQTYPEVRPLIEAGAKALHEQANSPEALEQGFHTEGFDVLKWIQNSETTPNDKYLSSSAVSQPLIGLTQLAHYFTTLKVSGKTPGEMRQLFKGATGHSQGVMSSIVLASSATDAEFITNSEKMVKYLLWQGIRMQQVSPETTLNPELVRESVAAGDGVPTQMLGLLKLSPDTVGKYIEEVNAQLPENRRVYITLVNGPRAVVVSGHPEGQHRLVQALRKAAVKSGQDQGRVPFSDRKLEFVANYFPVSAEFHSPYMAKIPIMMKDDMARLGIDFKAEDLAIPVYHTATGEDLRQSPSLLVDLILQQSILPVHWERATAAAHGDQGVSHVLDFGPGEAVGIGAITARNKEGTGVQVILAGSLKGGGLADKAQLFDTDPKAVRKAAHWERDFAPQLVRLPDGTLMVDTRFTRLMGKPPVMVAGMTPTTANEQIVAAFTNAGFHGELAGGGQHTEQYFRDRVDAIVKQIPAGEGITANLLFLNAYLWNFQYPLVEVMRSEGKPMDGVTIAAGVPSLENANEILASLRKNGIKHVSFKPGNIASIKQVIEIAKANPETQVVLQWTGGRGGGHHSYEDMHEPILQTYAAMRRLPNLTLVAGSGFGDSTDTLPYMTGEWSKRYGVPAMPFDAVLLASRVMASEEALTSPAAKELIAQAPGIEDESKWEQSYKGEAGGVVTVVSELGEPIHKLATRGIKLWKDFDAKYFNLPAEKAEEAIRQDKDEIIRRINADYQKLYFGQKADGRVADLPEMTYEEVLRRMVELMHVSNERGHRWMDVTFRDRAYDFLARTEERFHRGGDSVAFVQSPKQLEADPARFLTEFFKRYPKAKQALIASEDIDYFLNLCKRPGKPVNFIPVIDKDLKIWFKKDSLWQSEDLEAVPGQDVQRVAILQGPVAVRYTTQAGEPIGEILGGINHGLIDALKAKYVDENAIPKVEYLGGPAIEKVTAKDLPQVQFRIHTNEADSTVRRDIELPARADQMPDAKKWREFLAGPEYSWLRALLTTPTVVQGKDKVPNVMETLFRPRPGQKVEITDNAETDDFTSIRIFDPMMQVSGVPEGTPAVEVKRQGDQIIVTVNHPRPPTGPTETAKSIALQMIYRYNPRQGYAPIHEVMEGKNDRVKEFYAQLWFNDANIQSLTVEDAFTSSFTLSREAIRSFTRSIGNQQETFTDRGQEKLQAPLDMAIVAAWEPLIKTIFPKSIDGNIFRLLHLSNGFKVLDPRPLQEGDKVDTSMRILEARNVPGGKRVTVQGTLSREGKPAIELNSQFFIRGNFSDYQDTFHDRRDLRSVVLDSPEAVAVLQSKPWLSLLDGMELHPGDRLTFDVEHYDRFADKDRLATSVTAGSIYRNGEKIGTVGNSVHETAINLVRAYLERNGKPVDEPQPLANGGRDLLGEPDTVAVPKDNQPYAVASRDLNPIHVNPYIADLAELPTTITHGMWTSANGRRVVETYATNNQPERVVSYQAQFQGMVKPGDTLSTQVRHVGMRNGRMVLEVESSNQDGATVLKATAEVEAPKTAYVFTGQGSAEAGMGMDLYESSLVAKQIWDRADQHTRDTLGFSILDIVRNNPKELTLHFRGPKGARIRGNLRALTQEVVTTEDGQEQRKVVPLFPEIDATTESYTFRAPKGLLFATQFTQPAITLVEMAAYEDMRSQGLIPEGASFAGHSLGEYAGLSTVGKVLPVESVVELVFLRGMTMQGAVARDAQGKSPYGMIAARPGIIKNFGETELRQVVAAVETKSGQALEVVNYNVEGTEYVIAGELVNLEAVSQVLGTLLKSRAKLEDLDNLVAGALQAAAEKKAMAPDSFAPGRTKATVPLEGIDVPFHSKVLRGGVPAFRSMLEAKMPKHLDIDQLEGRYVPNLTAKPFSLDPAYVAEVYEQTKSPVLESLLDSMGRMEGPLTQELRQDYGRKLLLELLAYQFASPVRWIETQDHFFQQGGVERLIEVGPNVTLAKMAERTLGGKKYEGTPKRQLLSYKADRDQIYYEGGDTAAAPAKPPAEATKPAAKPAEAPKPAPQPVVAAAPPPPPAAGGAPIADAPVSPLEALRVLVAAKLKKSVAEVAESDSIKKLSGGNSSKQNEVIGDLAKEFGNGPDNAAELSLADLAKAMGASYQGVGKQARAQIDKLLSAKMPGGFGAAQVRAYLQSERRLGDGRIDGVLLHALTMEPPARLGSETEAKAWLDSVADAYGQKVGQAIPKGAAAPAAMASAPMMVAAGPAAQPVPDAPVSALDALRVLVAAKLKKSVGEIAPGDSIKKLSGGNSSKQNEVIGDLAKEFGSGPDNAAELSLTDLAKAMGGSYQGLGKQARGQIDKLLSSKMPGGFGMAQARAHLAGERMLGEGRTDGVLLQALSMEPPARLASEAEAKAWLDQVADSYAQAQGISVPRASQGGGAGVAVALGGGAPVDSAALKAFEARQEQLVRDFMRSYAEFLGDDPRSGEKKAEMEAELRRKAEEELGLWVREHGEFYANGIKPLFDSRRLREYESSWNLAKQDTLELYHGLASGKLKWGDPEVIRKADLIVNRATPDVLTVIDFHTRKAKAEGKPLLEAYFRTLSEVAHEKLNKPPVYFDRHTHMAPQLEIKPDGEIVYREVPRAGIKSASDYVAEMRTGSDYPMDQVPEGLPRHVLEQTIFALEGVLAALHTKKQISPQLQQGLGALEWQINNLREQQREHPGESINVEELQERVFALRGANVDPTLVANIDILEKLVGRIQNTQSPEELASYLKSAAGITAELKRPTGDPKVIADFEAQLSEQRARLSGKLRMPHLLMKKPLDNDQNTHVYDPKVTDVYLDALDKMAQDGVSFQGKTYLIVGAGKGSIAVELAKNLLSGGARVIVTTLFGTKEESDFYRQAYEQYGAKGSQLITIPMNQASVQDVDALAKYIYDPKEGLGLDLDGIIPFAAIPEQGRDIGNIDSRSELSHRMMLTNVIRLLGAVKNQKKERGIDTRPAHVVLPMSPNHGAFGSDGLYAESKIGLEPLLNKWKSEGWSNYLTIAGAVIGWTRGTGVMVANNVVSPGMEEAGARTFSQAEQAFNLMGLFHPDMVREAEQRPVWADLNGGFSGIRNLNEVSAKLRGQIDAESKSKKAVATDNKLDRESLGAKPEVKKTVSPRADFEFSFPQLPSQEKLESLKQLQGMVDLSKVVVVTGYGEVGPYGSARTRWEAESKGEFSMEGTIELAWLMGLIKYHNGPGKDGKPYTGWVDAKSNEAVADGEVKKRYEEKLLKHTGIRFVEPELFEGYDPHKKQFLREVVLTRDMNPVEVSNKEEADAFKLQHGDKVEVYERDGQWYAQLKKGATLRIPKALRFDRFAAGQIPTGWDATRYGVPAEIVKQVDPTTLYTLVSTVEAFVSAGITDPYEFYEYVHVSEAGNTTGGGMGGMRSIHRSFFERKLEHEVQGDILQEQLINVMPAWINMLLLSSSGPIKTPVGACATAAESVEIGVDTIQSGKAKLVLVGGYDDFGEEGSYEFANMQATSNTAEEVAKGRDPKEMSRPTAKTRSGFMEAQGAGVQVLMSADVAIKMGVPIYGIVAMTHTATDEQGRSVPAPGQGLLTAAREKAGRFPSPLLDLEYRRSQLEAERERIKAWTKLEQAKLNLKTDENWYQDLGLEAGIAFVEQHQQFIEQEAKRREQAALSLYGQDFYRQQAEISPIRGALAVWGLKPDDLAMTSIHGTGTQANDKNESSVVNQEMQHLGRSEGNPLFVIAQKGLTGHPKGAAAAWMFNGLVQSLLTGVVPGNRAADNIDPAMRENQHLVYPNRSMQVAGMKAGLLQSFGFGQAGAQILLIHPDYLFATLTTKEMEGYADKRSAREAKVTRLWQDTLAGKRLLMTVKTESPYAPEDRSQVLLDPTARAKYYPQLDSWSFSPPKEDDKKTGTKK